LARGTRWEHRAKGVGPFRRQDRLPASARRHLEHVTNVHARHEDAPRLHRDRPERSPGAIEGHDVDREAHPERVDRATAQEEQRLIRTERITTQEAPGSLAVRLGDLHVEPPQAHMSHGPTIGAPSDTGSGAG